MTARENMENLDKILDEYEQKIGLPQLKESTYSDIEDYLNMSRDELEKLTPEACGEIQYRLKAYSVYLGRIYNKEIARVNWAENLIYSVVAKDIGQYSGYGGAKIQLAQAIKGNEYAAELERIRIYAQQRANRLNFVATSIRDLADTLRGIAYDKKKDNQ